MGVFKEEKMMSSNQYNLEKMDNSIIKSGALAPHRSVRKTLSIYFPSSVPLKRPVIDRDFEDLPLIERVSEAIKYNALCLEYSISPKGGLRQWLKINLSLLLLLGIPIFIFVPLATYVMSGFADIAQQFARFTQFLLEGTVSIACSIGVLAATATVIKFVILPLLLKR
jgi:hypothetical protein